MFDATYPVDAARAWLSALLPSEIDRIEQASDEAIKASMDSAYAGGWKAWLRHYDDVKLVAE
jgi:hypothetical protein